MTRLTKYPSVIPRLIEIIIILGQKIEAEKLIGILKLLGQDYDEERLKQLEKAYESEELYEELRGFIKKNLKDQRHPKQKKD